MPGFLSDQPRDGNGRWSKVNRTERARRIKNVFRALYHAGIGSDKYQRLAMAHEIVHRHKYRADRVRKAFRKLGVKEYRPKDSPGQRASDLADRVRAKIRQHRAARKRKG